MKNVRFKLLIIKGDDNLQESINNFISGRFIIDLKVQYMLGSQYQTHQVYITYKND